ncbi:hypothetical protein [Candidatus Nitrotoga arctica]|uniref:hypothetical protein n=1 Tax=Candidatus Nitrotoga arctica TaxID=453162 RepID=UPI001EFB31A6|nr:hypothetical protein [Candidatus Nitrotoga arctica]
MRHIDELRAAMKTVKDAHPFAILAMVVLPEHLHAIWRACNRAIQTIYCAGRLSRPGSLGGWQKASTFVSAAKPSLSAASGSIGLWGEKIDDGVDGYGER